MAVFHVCEALGAALGSVLILQNCQHQAAQHCADNPCGQLYLACRSFDPKMGPIAQVLWACLPELLHVGLVLSIVAVLVAIMGAALFGDRAQSFSTFASRARLAARHCLSSACPSGLFQSHPAGKLSHLVLYPDVVLTTLSCCPLDHSGDQVLTEVTAKAGYPTNKKAERKPSG